MKILLNYVGLNENMKWIKRPKIILMLDDLSGTSLF